MNKRLLPPLLCAAIFVCFPRSGSTQTNFFRVYEDNDGMSLLGKLSDWGYTNGTRLDFFHQGKNSVSGFNFSAGKNSVVTSGWGLMQVMFTPKRIKPAIPDKNDYPYSGGLFLSHTIHSSNEKKKLNLQTEWILGTMGPPSLAKETQIYVHKIFRDLRPNGWDCQLPTDLLFNCNVAVEKQIQSAGLLELIGGGKAIAGTLSDGVSLFTLLKFRTNMNSFSGLANQYFTNNKKKPGFAISLKPAADLIFYNALLDGGLFNSRSPVHDKDCRYGTNLQRNKLTCHLDIQMLFSFRNVSISFNQKVSTPEFKGFSSQNLGNISIYFGW